MLRVDNLELLNGRKISFELDKGSILFINGENGTGKSLLLKSIAKLIPHLSGDLQFEGKKAHEYSVTEWRSSIMYLPANIVFEEDFTVDDFLKLPFSFKQYEGFSPSFNLTPYVENLDRKMSKLSSGQRQQMALLRTLSLHPKIMLLDESFGHMDQSKRKIYISLLEEFCKKGGSLICVTHDPIEFSLPINKIVLS